MLHASKLVALVVALALASCVSSSDDSDDKYKSSEAWDARQVKGPGVTIGAFLVKVDQEMRAWTTLALTAQTPLDDRQREAIEADLAFQVAKRFDEVVEQLETGPPVNRQVAAMALGFTRSERALSPLLAALHDEVPAVRSNALAALGLLGRPTTPVDQIRDLLANDPNETVRVQAALALRKIVEAGGDADDAVIETARNGLIDPAGGVRSECCLILGLLGDEDSIDLLAETLEDKIALAAAAAARALQMIGDDPHKLGPAARALTARLDDVSNAVKQTILVSLMALSGRNYGDNTEEWVAWANRLP